jgi:hypothetical protein
MFGQERFILAVVLASCAGLAGCESRATDTVAIAKAGKIASASPEDAARGGRSKPSNPVHAPGKAGAQQWVTYNDPEHGVTFRYPRNYALEEGDVAEHSYFLRRQEELDAEQPGAVLLATVLIPEDGYPNTTFEHGSIQLVINEALARESCREALTNGDPGWSALTDIVVANVAFSRSERRTIASGNEVVERDYTGFSNGACFEFLVVLASGDATDAENVKPADISKILRHLENIIASLQLHPVEPAPADADRPEIALRLQSQPTVLTWKCAERFPQDRVLPHQSHVLAG